MRVALALLLTAVVSMLISSCGYSLRGSGPVGDTGTGEYKSIAIPMFTNETYEPLVEREVTAALKEEVMYNGRLSLAESGGSDLVVSGRVMEFDLQPLTYDQAERVQEYRLRIVSEVKVSDVATGDIVWKDNRIEAFADYRVTADVTKSKISKGEAVKKASRNFAEKFIIQVLDIL